MQEDFIRKYKVGVGHKKMRNVQCIRRKQQSIHELEDGGTIHEHTYIFVFYAPWPMFHPLSPSMVPTLGPFYLSLYYWFLILVIKISYCIYNNNLTVILIENKFWKIFYFSKFMTFVRFTPFIFDISDFFFFFTLTITSPSTWPSKLKI